MSIAPLKWQGHAAPESETIESPTVDFVSEAKSNPVLSPRIMVVCLTYGEPADNSFLPQYQYSISILRRLTLRVAPIPAMVLPYIAARRARERGQKFTELGWSSPLEKHSEDQVNALAKLLHEQHPEIDWDVRLQFEFRQPYINENLARMDQAGELPDKIIMLPLYVADSDFTSGVSRTDLYNFYRQRRKTAPPLPEVVYVSAIGFDARLGKIMADFILGHCKRAGWTDQDMAESALILGAHGTVIRPPYGINNAGKETRTLFGHIRRHVLPKFRQVRIGWLNHKLGGVWTFPEVVESAAESQALGIRKVVYFPFGFVADNGESQLEGKQALDEFQWEKMLYLPCPNDLDSLIDYYRDRVAQAVQQPGEAWQKLDEPDPILARPELPPKQVAPQFGSLPSSGLWFIAVSYYAFAVALLSSRSFSLFQQIDTASARGWAIGLGLLAGWYKGRSIIQPGVQRNLVRLRRLPQPSPWHNVFSRTGWILVLAMPMLGMAVRYSSLDVAVRAGILIAVSLSLAMGTWTYLLERKKARALTEPQIARDK